MYAPVNTNLTAIVTSINKDPVTSTGCKQEGIMVKEAKESNNNLTNTGTYYVHCIIFIMFSTLCVYINDLIHFYFLYH